jgi:hypothetical protein
MGAEWFIPLSTGVKERPTLFGQPFDGPMEGHEPLMPRGMHHYDLHVWLWKENPAELFKPTNPELTCAGYGYSLAEDWPRLVPQRSTTGAVDFARRGAHRFSLPAA